MTSEGIRQAIEIANQMHQEEQPRTHVHVLDLDRNLRQAAILEAIHLLDQLQAHRPLPDECLLLARRARLRLTYYFRHSHAGCETASRALQLVESHCPPLARSLSLAPRRSLSLHTEPHQVDR